MPVETVDQSLDTGLVQVSDVARCLSRLLTGEKRIGVYGSESVDDDLSSNGLNGVNDHGHSSWVKRFERLKWSCNQLQIPAKSTHTHLLRVDVDAGEPAAETGMRVVPSDNHLRSTNETHQSIPWVEALADSPSSLLQHVEHFRLENVIDRLDRDGGTGLRHCKDVYTRDLEERQHVQRVEDRWQLTVYSSTNSPNINPMTSIGTPARPCLSI
jgi:hypothetical protein